MPKNTAKYLGVSLDKTLTYHQHVQDKLRKAYSLMEQLYPLVKNKKMEIRNKLLTYKTIVRPLITYAAPVWSGAPGYVKRPLQTYQNKWLRLITNSGHTTRIDTMHENAEIEYISKYIDNISEKFYRMDRCSEIIQDLTKIRKHNAPFKIKHKLPYQTLPIFLDKTYKKITVGAEKRRYDKIH